MSLSVKSRHTIEAIQVGPVKFSTHDCLRDYVSLEQTYDCPLSVKELRQLIRGLSLLADSMEAPIPASTWDDAAEAVDATFYSWGEPTDFR